MTRFLISTFAFLVAIAMATGSSADTVIGTFEFTDNSLAFTDADGGDGITVSDLNINSYTADEVWSDDADAVADVTLDFMSLNGVESPNGTSSGFSSGDYFSFTITNNSGDLLYLSTISGDFQKNNVFQQFGGRFFDTATPGDVVDDTISKLGPSSGGTDASFVTEIGFFDGSDPGAGTNYLGVPTIIADGASLTLHWVPNMNSNSTSRSMDIDNISISSRIPEPGSAALLGIGAIGLIARRRR